MREYKVQDLTGMTFGRWKVLYKSNKRDSNHIYWHCVCSCKNHTEKDVRADELKKWKFNLLWLYTFRSNEKLRPFKI